MTQAKDKSLPSFKMRKTPFGKFNPNRGSAHIEKARRLYEHFGVGTLSPLHGDAGIDAYLIAEGEMPAQTSHIERDHYRHAFLKKMRRASISENMRDIGLEPFNVHCQSNGWRLEHVTDNIERRTPQRKVRSQTRRSAQQHRQLMQTLDPVLDTRAIMLGSVTSQVLTVVEEISKVTDDAVGKAHRELKAIFGNLEMLKTTLPALPAVATGD